MASIFLKSLFFSRQFSKFSRLSGSSWNRSVIFLPIVDLRLESKKDSAEELINLIEREESSTSIPVVNSVNKKWFN